MSGVTTNEKKLVYMANQIAAFFAPQGEARAVPGIADHFLKFWTPQMRRTIVQLAEAEDPTLDTFARQAAKLIRSSQ